VTHGDIVHHWAAGDTAGEHWSGGPDG
jgi:hypothetical protein